MFLIQFIFSIFAKVLAGYFFLHWVYLIYPPAVGVLAPIVIWYCWFKGAYDDIHHKPNKLRIKDILGL